MHKDAHPLRRDWRGTRRTTQSREKETLKIKVKRGEKGEKQLRKSMKQKLILFDKIDKGSARLNMNKRMKTQMTKSRHKRKGIMRSSKKLKCL